MSTAASIRRYWDRLCRYPGGRWLFSRALGWVVPYSGSVGAHVLELEQGRALVALRDRRRVRNHLRSVHAVALINAAELASGLAMLYGLPDDARGIVTRIDARYLKKARGRLLAEGCAEIPSDNRPQEIPVETIIRDAEQQVVATLTVHWKIGPVEGAPCQTEVSD
jgi:acyl-coenzyme A thioesterase PaaI-like protein